MSWVADVLDGLGVTGRDQGTSFPDGAAFRIEIPSVEGPKVLEAVLRAAEAEGITVNRVSQGSGAVLMRAVELRDMARPGAGVEVCLFVGRGSGTGWGRTPGRGRPGARGPGPRPAPDLLRAGGRAAGHRGRDPQLPGRRPRPAPRGDAGAGPGRAAGRAGVEGLRGHVAVQPGDGQAPGRPRRQHGEHPGRRDAGRTGRDAGRGQHPARPVRGGPRPARRRRPRPGAWRPDQGRGAAVREVRAAQRAGRVSERAPPGGGGQRERDREGAPRGGGAGVGGLAGAWARATRWAPPPRGVHGRDMGLAMPGSAVLAAGDPRQSELAEAAGQRIVSMVAARRCGLCRYDSCGFR